MVRRYDIDESCMCSLFHTICCPGVTIAQMIMEVNVPTPKFFHAVLICCVCARSRTRRMGRWAAVESGTRISRSRSHINECRTAKHQQLWLFKDNAGFTLKGSQGGLYPEKMPLALFFRILNVPP